MSARVLLNLSNELRKIAKTRGLSSILSLFRNVFNIFNATGTRMIDSIDHKSYLKVAFLPSFTQR